MQAGIRRSAPLLATGFALLGGLVQVLGLGRDEPALERAVAGFNTVAPPAYRAFRRLEGGLTPW